MNKRRLFWQLYPAIVIITIVSLITIAILACVSFSTFYYGQTERDLQARAELIKDPIRDFLLKGSLAQIDELAKDFGQRSKTRFTVILPSGKVVGDSEKDILEMDNHKDRPEIMEAIKGAMGRSVRYSFTIKQEMMYVGIPIEGENQPLGIVRASLPMTSLENELWSIYFKVGIGCLILMFLVAGVSWWVSRSLSAPLEKMRTVAEKIAEGDFSQRIGVRSSDILEVSQLSSAMNQIRIQIKKRMETILIQKNEQSAILKSMTEGVLAIDLNERIQHLNRAAAQILNLDEKYAKNLHIQEVIRIPELQKFIINSLANGDTAEQEILLNGDNEKWIQIHGSPLLDANENNIGSVFVFSDVTRLRRLEKHRKEFVANVSHELRTPLTSIQGFAETLMNPSVSEPERVRFTKIINDHALRLDAIIEDLLTLSRIEKETEQTQIEFKNEKVQQVLEGAIDLCRVKAEKRGIPIKVECSPNIKVLMNAPLIERAIVNLVDNAIKYSEEKQLVLIQAAIEAENLVIRVKDQGMGIPSKNLSRLFERFYRVDKARSREQGGTGLGLSIVKHVALAHHGQVEVKSELGAGSQFTLSLPVQQ